MINENGVLVRTGALAVSASLTKPADATAYTAGDIIANSLTANLVVPLSFTLPRKS